MVRITGGVGRGDGRGRVASAARWVIAISACLGLAVAATPALSRYEKQKPLWEQVDELVCRGSHRLVCVEEICFKKTSKAQWRINFKEKKIYKSGLGGIAGADEFAEDVNSMDFAFYGDDRGSRHVIFFSGRIMTFDVDNAADAGGVAVSARSLHFSWRNPLGFDWEDADSSIETRFGCAAKGAPIEFVPNR